MNKEENRILPQLRFPEFKDDGDWEIKKLKNICDINPTNKELPEEFVYIDLESVEKGRLLKRNIINLKEAPSRAQRLLKKDDVIYQMVRPYQKNNFFFDIDDEFEYVASTGYALLRAFKSKMFLYQYLHTTSFVERVLSKCTGSNYPAINSSDLSRIKVIVPQNPKEQQKIAACLSSLDEVLTAETEKLDLLQDHKKGLLQQLFPAEGETQPKFRFPEFIEDGDWEETTLNDVCKITNGKSNAQDHIENGEYPLFDRSEVIKASDKYLFDCETVILPGEGMRFIPKYYSGKFDLHQRAYALKDFNCSGKYVYYYMLANINLLASKAVRSTVLSLRLPILQKFPIIMPNGKNAIQEQQKIADCLSAADELIEAQDQKIQALQEHKKGLLQQLFP